MTNINPNNLYEKDYQLWLENIVYKLKNKAFDQIDLDNLIEEIKSLGRSEKNALRSNLRVLLVHLLKWKYQQSKRSNSWQYTITEHSIRLNEAFKTSPSLKNYFREVFGECYADARKLAAKETGLSMETFPLECPFSAQNLLDYDYLPED